MAGQHQRPPSDLRDGAHPVRRGRRHRRLQQAERRPLPQRRSAGRLDHHHAAGRGARGDRDRAHRQDRGGGQHHQRHRRAALDLDRGRVAGVRHLPARQERRRRLAGGARSPGDGAARSARGHRVAGGQQARPRRVAGAVRRRRVRPLDPRHHRAGRPSDPPVAGEHLGRRSGDDHRRAQAPGAGAAGSQQAARRTA